MFDPANFKEVIYNGRQKIFFDKNYSFHQHFGHKRNTIKFPFHKNILQFLADSPETNIFFTLDENIKPFQKVDSGFVVNMNSYNQFCKTIGSKTGGRLKAFLGQNLRIKDILTTNAEKDEFIRENASETNILDALNNLPEKVQKNIIESFHFKDERDTTTSTAKEINKTEFINAFSKFLTDESVQAEYYLQLPKIQIETLKSHIAFLKANLDKNETFLQNWIDEENGKYRKQRCLIFGLEYVDPKREGEISSKRFDLLAEQDLENYVIFELKSPRDPIFKINSSSTVAGGITTEYNLSPQLARAIPEVLGYKELYQKATSEELQKMGIKTRKPISKCVIVLGTRNDDLVWKDNFERVRSCLTGIELLTYNHLIDRLENIVRNLEENT